MIKTYIERFQTLNISNHAAQKESSKIFCH